MSDFFVREQLEGLENAKKENRQRIANVMVQNTDYIKQIVNYTFLIDDKISIKAAWILEWICSHNNLNYIIPHLDKFTNNINLLQFDSAIRPCAKICEHLAVAYDSKKSIGNKNYLTTKHIEKIVSTGFDWLMTPQKIAVRAYAMQTLYIFGLYEDWIHPELKHLITNTIIHESKGTKAKGKLILQLIEKHHKSTF